MLWRMARKYKTNDLIFVFINNFCNKEKYLMFEHFKIHTKLLVANHFKPINKGSSELSQRECINTQSRKACSIPLKPLQKHKCNPLGLVSPLGLSFPTRVNLITRTWESLIESTCPLAVMKSLHGFNTHLTWVGNPSLSACAYHRD